MEWSKILTLIFACFSLHKKKKMQIFLSNSFSLLPKKKKQRNAFSLIFENASLMKSRLHYSNGFFFSAFKYALSKTTHTQNVKRTPRRKCRLRPLLLEITLRDAIARYDDYYSFSLASLVDKHFFFSSSYTENDSCIEKRRRSKRKPR